MRNKVAEIRLDGFRVRWPWRQMLAGDYFDVVARAQFEADAVRNTLASSAAAMSKRTGMKFMQRRIGDLTIRVFRVDGYSFGEGLHVAASYVGVDPVKLSPMKNGGIRLFRCGTAAEFEFTQGAVQRSVGHLTARSSELGGRKTYEVTEDEEAMTIRVVCRDPDEIAAGVL
jgi:hypothetical protein